MKEVSIKKSLVTFKWETAGSFNVQVTRNVYTHSFDIVPD